MRSIRPKNNLRTEQNKMMKFVPKLFHNIAVLGQHYFQKHFSQEIKPIKNSKPKIFYQKWQQLNKANRLSPV